MVVKGSSFEVGLYMGLFGSLQLLTNHSQEAGPSNGPSNFSSVDKTVRGALCLSDFRIPYIHLNQAFVSLHRVFKYEWVQPKLNSQFQESAFVEFFGSEE